MALEARGSSRVEDKSTSVQLVVASSPIYINISSCLLAFIAVTGAACVLSIEVISIVDLVLKAGTPTLCSLALSIQRL